MTSTQTRAFSTRIFDHGHSPVHERTPYTYPADDGRQRDESRTDNTMELFDAEHASPCAPGNVNASGARKKEYHKDISDYDIADVSLKDSNSNTDNVNDKRTGSSRLDNDVWYDVSEFCKYIGAFNNKNRHNRNLVTNKSQNSRNVTANKTKHAKNVVIWKDGYIVPLAHADDPLDDDDMSDDLPVAPYTSEHHTRRPDAVYDALKCKDPNFPVGHEWSPDFDTESSVESRTQFDILKVLGDEFVDEGLEYETDDSTGDFLDNEQEDVGSRVNDNFSCKIQGCECNKAEQRRCASPQRLSNSCHRTGSDSGNPRVATGTKPHTAEHERAAEDGAVSEKSYYTTDSEEEQEEEDEDEEEYEGYELVNWHGDWQTEHEEVARPKEATENFDTPPTSPNHTQAPVSGFHTAPNSPGSLSNSYCLVEADEEDGKCDTATAAAIQHVPVPEPQHDNLIVDDIDCDEFSVSKDGGRSNNAIAKSDKQINMYALDTFEIPCPKANTCEETTSTQSRDNINQSNVSQETRNLLASSDNNRIQANFTRPRHSFSQSRRVQQTLETPPLLHVRSIQYVADPKTNKVQTVGKGSFGQVYKARFSDPRYHHLRVVVKEFDEEFTTSREVVEEAQRLHYLKHTGYHHLRVVVKEFDEEFTTSREVVEEAQRLHYLRHTGYVPACYGLVNFGHRDNPRYGIVQEYIGTGLTLEQLLWNHYDLPLEMWLAIALQSCQGLDSFHGAGILLNDIKSNNIILEFFQDAVNIKYIDFGLATDMRGKRYRNTRSLGDFVYLAPEVRIHGNATTVASDVYSLGYMLEQVNREAAVPVLRFVAGLCMKADPADRTQVALAGDFIRNHMVNLGCDTARGGSDGSRDCEDAVMPDYW